MNGQSRWREAAEWTLVIVTAAVICWLLVGEGVGAW